jgi:hypothetical protein
MKLRLLRTGKAYNIYAIVLDNGECPAEDFIRSVKLTNTASSKSLTNIFSRHAEHGQIWNPKKSKRVHTKSGTILEFKTTQGDRILYFYDKGRKTILTHGFKKGYPPNPEYLRAQKIKEQYQRKVEGDQS